MCFRIIFFFKKITFPTHQSNVLFLLCVLWPSLKFLLRTQPNEASHVLDASEEGAKVSAEWLSFTLETLTGLPALPSELCFTGCTTCRQLRPVPRSYSLTFHPTWTGEASRPDADRRGDGYSAKYNTTEQGTHVCRC